MNGFNLILFLKNQETIKKEVQQASEAERRVTIEQIHKEGVSSFISMLKAILIVILVVEVIKWIFWNSQVINF